MSVVLSKIAPWNPRLRNTYRERYAEAGGRYFKVSAEWLDSPWWVEEIDFDGEPVREPSGDFRFLKLALRLSDARALIEDATQYSS
jgi:hypothetical protein